MSARSDEFVRAVELVVAQFESTLAEENWVTRRDSKRMRDEEGNVFSITSLMLFKGSLRLLLDPNGYDIPGAEGVLDLYLLPPYDPVAAFYLENGKWWIHSPFPLTLKVVASLNEWNRSPLTQESIKIVLEDIARHAVPSV